MTESQTILEKRKRQQLVYPQNGTHTTSERFKFASSFFDLYNQVNLFTRGDRSYFAGAGIGDLQKYFVAARRATRQLESGIALFNLLEEVVILKAKVRSSARI